MANKRIYELPQMGINGLTDKLTVRSKFAVDYTTDNGSTFVSKSIEAGDIMVIPMSKPANGTTSFTDLVPGALYYFDSGDQTAGSSNFIYLKAISETELSTTGYILQWIVKNAAYVGATFSSSFSDNYICKGVAYPGLYVDDPVPGFFDWQTGTAGPGTYSVVIWGGQVWKNGDDFSGFGNPITINNSHLTNQSILPSPFTPVQASTVLYEQKVFGIEYDFVKGKVRKQWDDRGNVFTLTKTDTVYRQNDSINWLKISDWGNLNIYNNKCGGIFNNRSSSTIEIYNNTNTGLIYINYQTGSIFENSNKSDIVSNYNSGYIRLNSNTSAIGFNSNSVGNISENANAGGITGNTNIGNIRNNSNLNNIDSNKNIGNIEFNTNIGVISNNQTGVNDISYNSNHGNILSNNNWDKIYYNSNLGDITDNSNHGSIAFNLNGSNINSNSNSGNIEGNSCTGTIATNSNIGNIEFNSNLGNIQSNANNGRIAHNSNKNYISLNNNNHEIYNNSNNGYIGNNSGSSTNAYISNNSNNGNITNNTGNRIANNMNNGSIYNNTGYVDTCMNNGFIYNQSAANNEWVNGNLN